MDHSVQGLTLINNEWVSRPLDVYEIMARARQEDVVIGETTTKPMTQVPSYGILSRTLLPSPLTRLILPANIRRTDLTDVVMIGEDFVQLKEVCQYGRLRHVAVKTDFRGARIVAAKVFGPSSDQGLIQSTPQMLVIRKHSRSMQGKVQVLPPQVIVLTLSTRTLMFLWCHQHQNGTVAFAQKTVRLPAGSSRFDRFGAFLAIDPKTRAMAVAAPEGRLILYKTKSIDAWRSDLDAGLGSIPIEDERIISFKGRVMHMDFLFSGNQLDEFHVVLLLVIVHQGKTKITCFDWDCRQDLDRATARAERVALDYGSLHVRA